MTVMPFTLPTNRPPPQTSAYVVIFFYSSPHSTHPSPANLVQFYLRKDTITRIQRLIIGVLHQSSVIERARAVDRRPTTPPPPPAEENRTVRWAHPFINYILLFVPLTAKTVYVCVCCLPACPLPHPRLSLNCDEPGVVLFSFFDFKEEIV